MFLCLHQLVPDIWHGSDKPLLSKPDGKNRYRRDVFGANVWCTFAGFSPRSDMCELRIRSAVCMQQNQTVRNKATHSPLSATLCFSAAHQTNRLSAAVTDEARFCPVHSALSAHGLITWHTYMTSSACNQIHMSPSLLPPPPLSLYLPLEFFPSFYPPMTLSPHSSFSLFIPCSPISSPSSSPTFFFFFFSVCVLFLISALASAWAPLLKWNVILIALQQTLSGLLWLKSVFYGRSLAEDLVFVVVMTCCTVLIVVISC